LGGLERSPCLLGIDLGTGSTKAVVVDPGGRVVSVGVESHAVCTPRPGWAESDPEAWWRSTLGAVNGALQAAVAHGHAPDVAALGLAGQMHGAVLVDAGRRPIGRAILWADQRAEAEAEAYSGLAPALRRALGNPVAPGMTGPVLAWLAAHDPERYRTARWALQAKDYLRARLTGTVVTEPSDASGTLLADLEQRNWCSEVVSALGLRGDLLPAVIASDSLAGSLLPEAASAVGLRAGVPVATGAGDTAAALVGPDAPGLGVVTVNVGTGAQVVARRLRPEPDEQFRYHVFAEAGDGYFALAAVQAAGLAFEWAWTALGCDWSQAYGLLEEAPVGAGGAIFVPHLAGSRSPRMAPSATGGFVGLRLSATRADLVRAVFEGVAFSIREAAESLPELAKASEVRIVGGGSVAPAWRQLLADVLGRPLRVTSAPHASARGAALLAAKAAGLVVGDGDTDDHPAEVVEPSRDAGALESAYECWREWSERLVVPPG